MSWNLVASIQNHQNFENKKKIDKRREEMILILGLASEDPMKMMES